MGPPKTKGVSIEYEPIHTTSRDEPSMSPFQTRGTTPTRDYGVLRPSLVTKGFYTWGPPPRNGSIDNRHFSSGPIPVRNRRPTHGFRTRPTLLVNTRPTRILSLRRATTRVSEQLTMGTPKELTRRPTGPTTRKRPPNFLLFRAHSLPTKRGYTPCRVCVRPRNIYVGRLFE